MTHKGILQISTHFTPDLANQQDMTTCHEAQVCKVRRPPIVRFHLTLTLGYRRNPWDFSPLNCSLKERKPVGSEDDHRDFKEFPQ